MADDIIEYLQDLKRSCEEAERQWFTADNNFIEYIHRKINDNLSVLAGLVACCADQGDLVVTDTVQVLYNKVLQIFGHYCSLLEQEQTLNEGSACPALVQTGRPGRPRCVVFFLFVKQ